MKHRRGLMGLAALALIAATAAAPAATSAQPEAGAAKTVKPRPKAAFTLNCGSTTPECLGVFKTSRRGTSLTGFTIHESCVGSIPELTNETIRVSRDGSFRVDETFEDGSGRQVQVLIEGRFSRSTLARGTYQLTGGGDCDGKPHRFTARHDRAASKCCKVRYRGGQVVATGILHYPRSAEFLYAPGCKARAGKGRASVTLKRDRDGFTRGYHTIAYVYRYRGKVVTRESAPFYVRGTAKR